MNTLEFSTVAENREIYHKYNGVYKFLTPELEDFLGEELYSCPASTMGTLHNACFGGLVDHMLKVAKYAVGINDLLPKDLKTPKESIIKVALLHDIGKCFQYEENKDEWSIKKLKKFYEFKNENVSMRVGQRSLYYALSNGVKLNEKEAQAILYFDTDGDDKMAKWHSEPLTKILQQAVELAIMDEKRNNNV